MNIIYIFSFLVAFLYSSLIFAQKSNQESNGDRFYERLAYKKAIKSYLNAEKLTVNGIKNLAESYKKIGDFNKAVQYYKKYIDNGEFEDEDIYNYAMILKYSGDYKESDKWFNSYAERQPRDYRVKQYLTNGKAVAALMEEKGRYNVKNLSFNSKEQEFAPTFFQNKIVFSSTLEVGVHPIKRTYSWNEKPFLDLFLADLNEDGEFSNIQNFDLSHKKTLNKYFHEGAACFAKKGTLMAFTRNDYIGKSSEGEVKLQIYFSEYKDGAWQKETPFKFNSSEHSAGQPWLSEDGNTMYFVSDMSGGYGGTDIYRIERNPNGEWGDLVNMGEKINTEGNEMFPFFEAKHGYLFFNSDGHPGFGGLDVFMAIMKGYAASKVINMGLGVNSNADDFSLIVDSYMKKGYLASNREGGKGDDDIYMFEILKPFKFHKIIKGTVFDQNNNELDEVSLELIDSDGLVVGTEKSREDGFFSFIVDDVNKTYFIKGQKEKFELGKSSEIIVNDEKEEFDTKLKLTKIPYFLMICRISDEDSFAPIGGATLKILNKSTGQTDIYETKEDGEFSKLLEGYKINDRVHIEITIEKEGYKSKSVLYDNRLTVDGEYIIRQSLKVKETE